MRFFYAGVGTSAERKIPRNNEPREEGVSGRDWGAARMRRNLEDAATASPTSSGAGIGL
jgi:hypothetical protein